MPELQVTTQNFYIKLTAGGREDYCTVLLELHNGVTHYNSEEKVLDLSSVSLNDQLQTKMAGSLKLPVVILSAPKINACHFILIRSQQNPHKVSMAHINPADDRLVSYTDLLTPFEPGETLDVVSYRDVSFDLLNRLAIARHCNLSTIRAIPGVFDYEPFVTWGEPKSVFINFIPEEDRFIIFSDEFDATKTRAVHISENVFKDSSKPIIFSEITNIANQPMNNWQQFKMLIPLLTDRAINDLPKSKAYRYEEAPYETLLQKRAAAIVRNFDFMSVDLGSNLLDEEAQARQARQDRQEEMRDALKTSRLSASLEETPSAASDEDTHENEPSIGSPTKK